MCPLPCVWTGPRRGRLQPLRGGDPPGAGAEEEGGGGAEEAAGGLQREALGLQVTSRPPSAGLLQRRLFPSSFSPGQPRGGRAVSSSPYRPLVFPCCQCRRPFVSFILLVFPGDHVTRTRPLRHLLDAENSCHSFNPCLSRRCFLYSIFEGS